MLWIVSIFWRVDYPAVRYPGSNLLVNACTRSRDAIEGLIHASREGSSAQRDARRFKGSIFLPQSHSSPQQLGARQATAAYSALRATPHPRARSPPPPLSSFNVSTACEFKLCSLNHFTVSSSRSAGLPPGCAHSLHTYVSARAALTHITVADRASALTESS
jgi:hypothetical protein